MIGYRSAAHVREYALIAAHQAQQDDRNDWRGFGMLEVITQRWRPTGRPIYTYLRPLDHQAKGVGGGLSIVPFHQGSGEIAAVATFEREAFFARKAVDAEAIPARIEPLHPMLPGAAATPL